VCDSVVVDKTAVESCIKLVVFVTIGQYLVINPCLSLPFPVFVETVIDHLCNCFDMVLAAFYAHSNGST